MTLDTAIILLAYLVTATSVFVIYYVLNCRVNDLQSRVLELAQNIQLGIKNEIELLECIEKLSIRDEKK